MGILSTIVLISLILLFPSRISACATGALRVWGLDVVPSLFPYMVLCQSLTSRLLSRDIPALLLVAPLSFLGGSPAGSIVLASCARKGRLSSKQICFLLPMIGTISPMFFLGPVSQWFASPIVGKKLLFSNILGAVCASILFGAFSPSKAVFHIEDSLSGEQAPISKSVSAVINVGGCIVFYSVCADCIGILFPSLSNSIGAVIHAVLEISGGLKALSESQMPHNLQMIICAMCSGFGGFSIFSQNMLFLTPIGFSARLLLLSSVLRSICCALIICLFS